MKNNQPQQPEQAKTILVLGASGGIGGEVARQLRDANWTVKALKRGLSVPTEVRDGITWINGDAMDAASVAGAAQGVVAIVHAVNPPGYHDWDKVVLPMLDNTIAAAERTGALVILPGTVYNYGPDAFPLLNEEAPQRPLTRKGGIRVEMERRLSAYTQRGGRVLIVRAGDFFGPQAANSWFSQGLVKPGKKITSILNPAKAGIGHQWSYLPDVARTVIALLERRNTLEPFATFHMGEHWDANGTQMPDTIRRVVIRHGGAAPKITGFPWWLLKLAAPFVTTLRELQEMRYLWQQPVRMSNAKLVATLGKEPFTPLDEAVEATLRGLKCI